MVTVEPHQSQQPVPSLDSDLRGLGFARIRIGEVQLYLVSSKMRVSDNLKSWLSHYLEVHVVVTAVSFTTNMTHV